MTTHPFLYSDTNKRYHTYDYYLKHTFGGKVFKVALDAGFGCPNRDGHKGIGGCTFCSVSGSGDFAGDIHDPLEVQFEKIKTMMHLKWPVAQYIAYFQAYTNTYAPLHVLKETFEPFIGKENVVGLSIATRPDCVSEEVIDYLVSIHERTHLWVELGLQTIHDETAQGFNRGYETSVFYDAVHRLRQRGLRVLVHLINGFPDETPDMMIASARAVAALDIQGVKIHSLFVLGNSQLGRAYKKAPFPMLTQAQYVEVVVRQLELFSPRVVVQRVTGDAPAHDLVAPLWTIKKTAVTNDIDKLMVSQHTWQGKYYDELIAADR